ncbi:MAG: E3 binding domain-containing protein, partial [Pseudomonadota bacterium]
MPTEVYLVKVGMNMTEGVVEEWYIPDGGTVSEGELLYRLETEKVNLDVDAEANGTVKHLVAEGVTMEPGDVVGYIYPAGEEIPESLPGAGSVAGSNTESAAATPAPEPLPAAAAGPARAGAAVAGAAVAADGRIKASPIARRLARERALDLTLIAGTGPEGRIVEADVLAAEVPLTAEAAV